MIYWLIGVGVFLILVMTVRIIWEVRHFEEVEYCVISPKINGEEQLLVLITDLHSCEYGKYNELLINCIKKSSPDSIFIAGDMIVGKKEEDGSIAVNFLQQLNRDFPIYYGNGNHESRMKEDTEYYGDSYSKYREQLDSLELTILENESCKYQSADNIVVYGLEIDKKYYDKRHRMKMSKNYITELLGVPDPDKFNILIAHNPSYFEQYAAWGADLVLSGHNHGGIIGIPFINRGLISPQFVLFEKYGRGMFENSNCKMILSSGLGTHSIKFRLFNKQQLVYIRIKGKE